MMRGTKRMLPVGFGVGVLCALAFAVPASAAFDDGTCQINGTAATNPPVPLTGGGTGSYAFDTSVGGTLLQLTCAGVDSPSNTTAVFQVGVASQGTYNNIVCGTGSADSPGGQLNTRVFSTTLLSGNPQIVTDLTNAIPGVAYRMFFAAGQGRFEWLPSSTIWTAGSGGTPTYTGLAERGNDGVISIVPAFDNNPFANQCTTHFTVAGAITGEWSGA
jgi:hypothetical protein